METAKLNSAQSRMEQPHPQRNMKVRSCRDPLFAALNGFVRFFPVKSKFYGNIIIFKKDLQIRLPVLHGLKNNIPIHRATDEDVRWIQCHPEKSHIHFTFEHRLAKGHWGYVAKEKGEILGYLWMNFDSFSHFYGSKHPFLFHPLDRQEVFSYDWYVFKSYRQKNVATALVQNMLKEMKALGIRIVYSTAEMDNFKSIKLHLKNGFLPDGFVHLYRIGNYKRVFHGTEEEAKALKKWAKDFLNPEMKCKHL